MRWCLSDSFDVRALPLADRHYNRRKIGSPQFAPPGRRLVLLTADASAFWITSYPFAEYVRHRWGGAWVCSAFRNEGSERSSDLIVDALAATRSIWEPPRIATWIIVSRRPDRTIVERGEVAMVTFVDRNKVRRKRDPGRCYRRAGFEEIGQTEGGLVALGIRTERMPPARAAVGAQLALVTHA